MSVALKINEELNGIELYFDGKPSEDVRNNLKNNGFRWSGFKKCWYTKQSDRAFKVAETLTNGTAAINTPIIEKAPKTAKKAVKTMSLWDSCQWSDLELTQAQRDQEDKLIAKEMRTHIRKRFPQVKFSVTCPYYGRIRFEIKSSPYTKDSTYLKAVREYCENLLNAWRHCYSPSDPYTDYAGVYNFTGWVEVDWDYKQTEVTEDVKKDMTDFDSKLVEFEKAEEARKEAEYEEHRKQREIEAIAAQKRQEEREQQKKHIYNSVDVKTLEDNDQYFVIGSEFAQLNKNNTLEQYKEEVQKGDFYLNNVKVTKEIHFTNTEALSYFENMLLHDFDFLEGTGGSYTDDNRINTMTDYYNMDEEERETVEWNLSGVAVYFNNKLQFVVDAQGSSYARYVGLTDNATIQKSFTFDQVIEDEELEQLKQQATQLEDISTSAIEELNIMKTWENENWSDYKETVKNKLKGYNFRLNKRIIQQLDLEPLKVVMYKILVEVDGIQEQFKDADIQQGEKLTLFYISDFGSIVTSRITFDSVEPCKYAQYDNAVKLIFTPNNKRKLHYKHFYSELLVYKGWHELPQEVLHNVEQKNGFIVTSTKYHSCDHKQYDEILTHFEQQNIKPIINTYRPTF